MQIHRFTRASIDLCHECIGRGDRLRLRQHSIIYLLFTTMPNDHIAICRVRSTSACRPRRPAVSSPPPSTRVSTTKTSPQTSCTNGRRHCRWSRYQPARAAQHLRMYAHARCARQGTAAGAHNRCACYYIHALRSVLCCAVLCCAVLCCAVHSTSGTTSRSQTSLR